MAVLTWRPWSTCMTSCLVGILILLAIPSHSIQDNEPTQANKCTKQTTCSECITAGSDCAWCKSKNMSSDSSSRCDVVENQQRRCDSIDIVNPEMETITLKEEPLSKPGANVDNIVQLMPQRIQLKIRPNSPIDFTVKFRQAEDYPVDLYYLMDLSNSMSDDKAKLASLGKLLGTTMANITKNFRLGYGSFVDKSVAPFSSIHPNKLLAPCQGCVSPYGFKNHMPLNQDTQRFVTEVNKSPISGNIDAPEGSFDAIMQAIVCTRDIGWRDKARKILLVATDAESHHAGDGKLGGIMVPNDGLCHLNEKQQYTESNFQDYPSISQIRQKVKEHNVNILFAVTSNAFTMYDELSGIIDGCYTGELSKNSDNIVDLIQEQYKKISSSVELKDNSSSNVRVTYYSKCLNSIGSPEQTNTCTGLKIGTTVDFNIRIEVASCPSNLQDRKQVFHISPVGLSETLVVELDLICECDCQQIDAIETKSGKCSNVGTYECGICNCPPERHGEFCQCDQQSMANDLDETTCKMGNSTISCSGRGTCACGRCSCRQPELPDRQVYGTYCECDNFSCARHNNLMCGGPDHGKCDCGQCVCRPEWKGDACDCSTSKEACTRKGELTCSGRGTCECGGCKCEPSYGGLFCEQNISPGGKCVEYRNCAQCEGFPKQSQENECEKCNYTIKVVPELHEPKEGEFKCSFKDDDGCVFFFIYTFSENSENAPILVQQNRECPQPVNLPLVITSVIGSIVAIGLALLLIWKLLTVVHDRREYAKFEKDRLLAKWDKAQNPIYVDAVTKFQNPTYNATDNQ